MRKKRASRPPAAAVRIARLEELVARLQRENGELAGRLAALEQSPAAMPYPLPMPYPVPCPMPPAPAIVTLPHTQPYQPAYQHQVWPPCDAPLTIPPPPCPRPLMGNAITYSITV